MSGDEDLGFVHRFEPGGGDRRTLLALHGTGGDEGDLIPLARMLAPAANVLSPRGRVLERGMPRFFRRLAEGVFDEQDLVLRTRELAGFVGLAAARYGFDPSRVIAVGFSNGANIAASLLLLEPGTLSGALLFRPMPPLQPPVPPDLSAVRVFMSAGRADPWSSRAEELARMLGDYGARVELRWIEAGHELTREDVDLAREWLDASAGSRASFAPEEGP